MTRDEFRNGVFARDQFKCIVCKAPAQDAHHIIERRLFEDGGYSLDNGASLCGPCHILAEQTLISPDELRAKAGILKIHLPPHLYPDYEYDKWGNITNPNGSRVKGELFFDGSVQKILAAGKVLDRFLPHVKYPRTYHLPFSLGRTEDDRALRDCSQFEGKRVIVTVKMDGENTTGYSDGYVHARSLDSNNHPSRNWVKNYLSGLLFELPKGWHICGENLFAKHSIHYNNLQSYFYLFSIWNERNECLAWNDVTDWAALLDIPVVPVLYDGIWNENHIKGLFNETYNGNECEGFVVRIADKFEYCNFRKSVAKFVRPQHVQTNQHWIKTAIVKNNLA